jgi:two-component system, response regulator YesN
VYRVIIVEDSDWIRRGLEFTVPWQDYGFTVAGTAANGRDGYDLAMRLEPDLALVDIKMPVMDGLEMIEALREDGFRSPEFIVVSGYDDFSLARRAILLGARDYLLKPVSDEDLAAALKRMSAALSRTDSARRLESLLEGQSFDPEFVEFFRRLLDESVRKDDLVGYAVRRVEERFDTDISLGDIAAELEVSESTLGRRFKAATGYTFVEYATMVRVRKALEMLADPACRVNEVAYKVGISDARYFSSLFKRYTGFTPSQFRKIVEGSPTDRPRDEAEGEPR